MGVNGRVRSWATKETVEDVESEFFLYVSMPLLGMVWLLHAVYVSLISNLYDISHLKDCMLVCFDL